MARRGVPSVGLDFQPRSYAAAEALAQQEGLSGAEFWSVNLLEVRQLLGAGALLSRRPGPRVVTARHLVDTLKAPARRRLWRLARMATAGAPGEAGRFYLEFLSRVGEDRYPGQHRVRRRRPAMIIEEIRAAGGTVVHREDLRVSDAPGASKLCRLVVEWRAGEERHG
jgi:hypothetical protein